MQNNQLATLQGFAMFQRPATKGIKLFDTPIKIKFNCSNKGMITDAQDTYISNTMKMIILNSKEQHAQLFKYPSQMWREIIFVNSDDTVCVTLIKGESLSQYRTCVQSILSKGFAVAECTITAKFASRTSGRGEPYSVIEFTWEKSTDEKMDMVVDFVKNNPQIMAYSYLDELIRPLTHIDTDTGEEIIEHGNMAVKTDGFGEQYKD